MKNLSDNFIIYLQQYCNKFILNLDLNICTPNSNKSLKLIRILPLDINKNLNLIFNNNPL